MASSKALFASSRIEETSLVSISSSAERGLLLMAEVVIYKKRNRSNFSSGENTSIGIDMK